ncbi:MAG: archaeal proteasome endopeptidase complex subunit alpha [Candidatus Aenigmarchaeota archaeon]|nr:archaeal proteasome endopeptidase complex subunit alpha [Candidatus Aenigmarchaeota archaeon]
MMSENMGYDRAITTFSPDGRLFQVEYAREAVKKGSSVVSICLNKKEKMIVFCTRKRQSNIVLSIEKIFKIDEHIAAASAGLIADARLLIEEARVKSQQNQILYDEPISVFSLAKSIADKKQVYTQYAGVRPYGVSLLIGGINHEAVLYETDPSGFMMQAKARAIGQNADKVNEFLEKEYKEDLDINSAIKLAVNAMKKSEEKTKIEETNVWTLTEKGINEYSTDELKKILD